VQRSCRRQKPRACKDNRRHLQAANKSVPTRSLVVAVGVAASWSPSQVGQISLGSNQISDATTCQWEIGLWKGASFQNFSLWPVALE
jgi:hypothetical protein